MMGQNYLRSLFALGFQGFLILVCVGIYAVLIQSVAFSTDIIASLWRVMGFTIGPSELTGNIEGYPKLLQALKEISPVPVSFEMIEGNVKGYYHQEDKRIVVQDGMSEVQTIKTLLHEMAHQQMHDKDQVPEAKNFTKNSVETEAESVAYVVCQHYGINTSDYSFSYVAGWSKNKETPELKASLDKIRQTAADFITKIDERLELSQEIDKVKIAPEQAANPDLASTVNKELEKVAKQRKSVKSKLKEAETKPKKSTAKTKKKEEMVV